MIIYSILEPLLAAEVSLLVVSMGTCPRKKLNLLQFAAGLMAESGIRSAEVVRR